MIMGKHESLFQICLLLSVSACFSLFTPLPKLYNQLWDASEHCFWHNFIKEQSLWHSFHTGQFPSRAALLTIPLSPVVYQLMPVIVLDSHLSKILTGSVYFLCFFGASWFWHCWKQSFGASLIADCSQLPGPWRSKSLVWGTKVLHEKKSEQERSVTAPRSPSSITAVKVSMRLWVKSSLKCECANFVITATTVLSHAITGQMNALPC